MCVCVSECECVCVCVLVVELIQLVHTGGVNMRRDSCTIVWKSGLLHSDIVLAIERFPPEQYMLNNRMKQRVMKQPVTVFPCTRFTGP